jgi:hypothetical protein
MTKKTDYEKALYAAETLANRSRDGLYEQLGLRIQDLQNMGGYERSKKFSAEYSHDADDMLSIADLQEIGRKWAKKFEHEMMNMICEKDNIDIDKITGGKTIAQVAASLATSTVVAVLAPPSWVIVATTIIASKLAETGLDSLCEQYSENEKVTASS